MPQTSERLQEYAEELRRDFLGEIRTDRFSCALYGTDASICQIDPLAVLVPRSHQVTEIESGCCGMAGAFGYEREHFALSMQIGELSFFPAIRKAPPEAEIVASGISCRQQILQGTGRTARHIAEILAGVLLEQNSEPSGEHWKARAITESKSLETSFRC